MTIYLILLLAFGIAGWLSIFKPTGFSNAKSLNQINNSFQKRNKKQIVIISVLLLALVAGCRGLMVGVDTLNYYNYFSYKRIFNETILFEPMYEVLNLFIIKLGLPYNYLLFLCSILTIGSFGLMIYNFSDCPALVFFFFVALGFFGNTFNAVRQYLALAVFLFAIKYIRDGGFIKYLLLILIASLFHTSAIILIPVYIVRYIKLKPVFIISLLIVVVALSIFFVPMIRSITALLGISYFDRYLNSDAFLQGISLYNALYSIGMLAVFFIFYFMRKKVCELRKSTQNYDLFLMLFFISVCIRIFGTFSGMFSLVNRLNIYFFFAIIFLMPYLFECMSGAWKKICVVVTLVLGVAYNLISGVLRGSNGIYPYKFIWGNQVVASIVFFAVFVMLIAVLIIKVIQNKSEVKNAK